MTMDRASVRTTGGAASFRWVYSQMVLIVTVCVIVAGFSHTVGRVLLAPPVPAPPILWLHVILASLWLGCILVQSHLAAQRQIALHRRLAPFGVAVGSAMSLVAFLTAVELRKLDIGADAAADLAYLAIPLAAWITFSVPFFLALLWRSRPERHRALMIVAVCTLAGPALGRFPEIRHAGLYWAGLIPDILLASVALHDRWRSGRWTPVYLVALPLLLIVQGGAVYLEIVHPPAWVATARWLLAVF